MTLGVMQRWHLYLKGDDKKIVMELLKIWLIIFRDVSLKMPITKKNKFFFGHPYN
jgi:hypothetical protein